MSDGLHVVIGGAGLAGSMLASLLAASRSTNDEGIHVVEDSSAAARSIWHCPTEASRRLAVSGFEITS